jgi:hypothetical protein
VENLYELANKRKQLDGRARDIKNELADCRAELEKLEGRTDSGSAERIRRRNKQALRLTEELAELTTGTTARPTNPRSKRNGNGIDLLDG